MFLISGSDVHEAQNEANGDPMKTYIFKMLDKQREEGTFCDSVIQCEGEDFHAHSNILSAVSPYLKTLHRGSFIPEQLNNKIVIDLNNFKKEAVRFFLYVVYGSQSLTDVNVYLEDLLQLADFLQSKAILEFLLKVIRGKIRVDNCLYLYECSGKFNATHIQQLSCIYISNHFENVITSPKWKLLSQETFETLVKSPLIKSQPDDLLGKALKNFMIGELSKKDANTILLYQCFQTTSMLDKVIAISGGGKVDYNKNTIPLNEWKTKFVSFHLFMLQHHLFAVGTKQRITGQPITRLEIMKYDQISQSYSIICPLELDFSGFQPLVLVGADRDPSYRFVIVLKVYACASPNHILLICSFKGSHFAIKYDLVNKAIIKNFRVISSLVDSSYYFTYSKNEDKLYVVMAAGNVAHFMSSFLRNDDTLDHLCDFEVENYYHIDCFGDFLYSFKVQGDNCLKVERYNQYESAWSSVSSFDVPVDDDVSAVLFLSSSDGVYLIFTLGTGVHQVYFYNIKLETLSDVFIFQQTDFISGLVVPHSLLI